MKEPLQLLVIAAREWRERKYPQARSFAAAVSDVDSPLVSAIDQTRERHAIPSRVELDEFARIRDRITALTLHPNLPREIWVQLCNLDTDMARAIGSARTS